jgi:hypothetical protein
MSILHPSQHQNKYQHLLESFHILRKDYTLWFF